MFDSIARLQVVLGRPGAGPGEFGSPITALIVDRADTLTAFHGARASVYSPSFTFVRSVQLPAVVHAAVLARGGEFVVNMPIGTPALVGLPLHVLGRDGSVLRSFGSERPDVRPGQTSLYRSLAVGCAENTVWSGMFDGNQVRAELWRVDGVKLADVTLPPASIPGGTILSCMENEVLWLATNFNSSPVDPAVLSQIRQGRGAWRRATPATRLERLAYDSQVVRAFDLRSRRLVGSTVMSAWMSLIPNSDLGYSTRIDSTGVVHIDVWRVSRSGN